MRLWIRASGAAVVIGIAAVVGCGGKVTVEGTGAAGGAGGAGGQGGTTYDGTFTTAITTGPTTSSVTSSVTTGPTTSVTSSVTTGPTTFCDDTGQCSNGMDGCAECAYGPGGPCVEPYEVCISSDECLALLDCFQSCDENDPQCYQKCADSFPSGAEQYNDLVICVICDACYNDCDGQASGCP